MNTFEDVMILLEVDYPKLLARFSQNEFLLQKIVLKFIQDPSFNALEKAFHENDVDQLLMYAHTLKGTSANLGFDKLSLYCAEMVNALRLEEHSVLPSQFNHIQREYHHIIQTLKQFE